MHLISWTHRRGSEHHYLVVYGALSQIILVQYDALSNNSSKLIQPDQIIINSMKIIPLNQLKLSQSNKAGFIVKHSLKPKCCDFF
jgi:hypothetical protein